MPRHRVLHFFQQERSVTSSVVMRIDPFPAPADVIGNGRYTSSLDVIAVQFSAAF